LCFLAVLIIWYKRLTEPRVEEGHKFPNKQFPKLFFYCLLVSIIFLHFINMVTKYQYIRQGPEGNKQKTTCNLKIPKM